MVLRLHRCLFGSLVLAVALGAACLFAGPASAAPRVPAAYGPNACTVTVSINPSTVGHGGTITISLSGTCGDRTFTIVIHNHTVTLGTINTDAFGNGSGTFTLPCSVNVGAHTVTATDQYGNTGSSPLTVTPGPCAAAPGLAASHSSPPGLGASQSSSLPFTGTDAAGFGAVAAGIIGVGGLLVLGSRKRRRGSFT
jgi:LPXTG-motif cell wall-anchored protein